jgi:hypothetical protein
LDKFDDGNSGGDDSDYSNEDSKNPKKENSKEDPKNTGNSINNKV